MVLNNEVEGKENPDLRSMVIIDGPGLKNKGDIEIAEVIEKKHGKEVKIKRLRRLKQGGMAMIMQTTPADHSQLLT